jgi:HPt (histidine-containing phosphotransfer) domain-containing protein
MTGAGQQQLSETLNRLWIEFLPQLHERVALLRTASKALEGGKLSDPQRTAANLAAHKLAGVLGTFGLAGGTEIAREAENLFSGEQGLDSGTAARVGQIADQIDAMIARRTSTIAS